MATLKADLNITTNTKENYLCQMEANYNTVYSTKTEVDNSDEFIVIASLGSAIASDEGTRLRNSKALVLKNTGAVPVELLFMYSEWKDSSDVDITNDLDIGPDSNTVVRQFSKILTPDEYMFIPNQWLVGYAEAHSAGNAKTIDNVTGKTRHTTLAIDSTADIDSATADGIIGDAAATTIYLEPYTSATNCTANLFRVGDLIRVDDEIMEVTGIGAKAALATNTLTVIRASHGSTAAGDHADDEAVEFAFFNSYNDFDKYSYAQTDGSGRFGCTNLFGYARSLTYPSGIVKGSFAMKFYNRGYQELGLSGQTLGTSSGLAVSTAYQFNLTLDGGSASSIAFTTDSSNVNWGGTNGVLSKINSAIQTATETSGNNLYGKSCTVSIIGGDVRFSSNDRTSVSAVTLADSSGSDTDVWGVGQFPAIGSVDAAVASKLPDDTVRSRVDYIESPNSSSFAYDDGRGNIKGMATGTINYETGALDFIGPARAEFAVSFNYDSAHSGGVNETASQENGLREVRARSLNSKVNSEVQLISFV